MDTVERKFFAGSFGSLAVLGTLVLVTYFKGADFIVRSRELYRIHSVLLKMDEVIRGVADAGDHEAAFVLKGSAKDLDACQDDFFNIDRLVGDIQHLSSRQQAQAQRLKQLEPLVATQVKLLASAIHWRQSAGPLAAAAHFDQRAARRSLVGLGALLEDFKSRETTLMGAQSQDFERKTVEVSRAAGLSALASLLIFGFIHWLIHREMLRRREAEAELERQTAILSSVINDMSDAVVVYDRDGQATVANPAARHLLRSLAERLSLEAFQRDGSFQSEDGEQAFRYEDLPAVRALAGKDSSTCTLRLDRGGRGLELYYSASARIFRGPQGALNGAMAIYHDITTMKRDELSMLEAKADLEDRIEALSRHSQDMQVVATMTDAFRSCRDQTEVCRAAARTLQQLLPRSSGSFYLYDPALEVLLPRAQWGPVPGESHPIKHQDCLGLIAGRSHLSRAGQPKRCDHFNEPFPPHGLCVPLDIPGAARGLIEIGMLKSDAAALRLISAVALQCSTALGQMFQQELLRSRLILDPLTGLYNRRHMDEVFVECLEEAHQGGGPMAVIMTDIDHFKRFNDAFGHAAGDLVLRRVATAVGGALRPADRLFRFGGEEFTALLPGIGLDEAMLTAERARKSVEGLHLTHQGQDLGRLSISLGVAGYPETSDTMQELLRQADAALYEAKHSGRNCSILWHQPRQHAA